MSASDDSSAVFMTDTAEQIETKITKYAFSGGGATMKEHKANGANLAVDVPFQYLSFFLEDDARLAEIGEAYGGGTMTTREIKGILVELL